MNIEYNLQSPRVIRNDGTAGNQPVTIRSRSGPITWRKLLVCYRWGPYGLEAHFDGTHKDSDHEFLLVHVSGHATITEEEGKTIAVGYGLSAPEVRES